MLSQTKMKKKSTSIYKRYWTIHKYLLQIRYVKWMSYWQTAYVYVSRDDPYPSDMVTLHYVSWKQAKIFMVIVPHWVRWRIPVLFKWQVSALDKSRHHGNRAHWQCLTQKSVNNIVSHTVEVYKGNDSSMRKCIDSRLGNIFFLSSRVLQCRALTFCDLSQQGVPLSHSLLRRVTGVLVWIWTIKYRKRRQRKWGHWVIRCEIWISHGLIVA